MSEKQYFETLKGKHIKVSKVINSYEYFYKGYITEILEDGILFNDQKIGILKLTFQNLSVVNIIGDSQ